MRTSTYGYPVAKRRARRSCRHILVWALLAILFLLTFLYLGRTFEIRRLRGDLSILAQQAKGALATQEELRARLALQNDPVMIENAARRLLGLVKPGEEKVIFIEGN
ncbi:septum formation initiator family protein [Candidatus Bipolaricaulota bacterium]|nr:septum formation initiator family protein [Candidatus Bipolaricaulota bacterium]